MRRLGLLIALASLVGTTAEAGPIYVLALPAQVDFYVSSTGSDVTGDGSSTSPWATAEKARAWLRTNRSILSTAHDTVVHLSGDLQRTSVTLTDADGGFSSSARVVYDGGGTGRIIGGYKLDTSTCVVYSGSIYKCPVGSSDSFYTMYEDGVRGMLARSPNRGYDVNFPDAQGPYFLAADSGSPSHSILQYNPVDFNPAGWTATDLSVVVHQGESGNEEWFWGVTPVASVNTSTHQFTLTQNLKWYAYNVAGSRYYIEGALPLLDAAREFYLDRAGHFLYYYPSNGTITGHEIIIPTTTDAIRIVGTDTSHLASYVAIRNVTVTGTDFTSWWRYGNWGKDYPTPPCTSTGPDWDSSNDAGHTYCGQNIFATITTQRHAGIYLENTSNITIDGVHVTDTGYSGVFAYGKNSATTLTNSCIDHTGYSAFQTEGAFPSEGDINTAHSVSNTIFARPGELVHHGRCLDYMATSSTAVSNIECARGLREGTFLIGDCSASTPGLCYTQGNHIANAWLHDLVEDSSDAGGLYTASLYAGSAPYPANYYDAIYVDRVFSNPTIRFRAPSGFYFDAGSNAQYVSNADCTNCGNGSLITAGGLVGPTVFNTIWTALDTNGMRYASDGVNRLTHPYPACGQTPFTDTFESGLGNWTTGLGSPALSTSQAHSPTHSFGSADGTVIYRVSEGAQRALVTIWFYDDATSTTAENLAHVDENTYSGGTFTNWNTSFSVWRAMGVDTSTTTGFYVAMYTNVTHITTVARSTGWHSLTWDYRSNDHVDMSIDGVLVARPTGVRQFNVIAMGDFVADARSGPGYFDDVSVTY